MFMDSTLEFADAATVVGSTGTINVGNFIDSTVVRDLGNGQAIYLVVTVDTEIITAGSAGTLRFALVSDSTTTIATDGSATEHYRSHDFVTDDAAANAAEMAAGGVPVIVALPWQGVPYERYLAFQAVIGGQDTTEGAVNAFLTLDPARWISHADAAN